MARTRGTDPTRAAPIHGPVRTCVGCRSRGSVSGLLRVVAGDGALCPDTRRRLPGRGAWLHPDPECLHRAQKRTAFARALRVAGPLDPAPVRSLLEAAPDAVPTRGPMSRPDTEEQVDPS